MFMGKIPFEEGELDSYFQEARSISLLKEEHDVISKNIQNKITERPSKIWRFTMKTMRVAFMFSLFFLSGAFIYQNIENENVHNLFNSNQGSSEKNDFGVIEPIGIHHPDSIKMERVNGRREWSFTAEGLKHVFLPLDAHNKIGEIVKEPYLSVHRILGKGVEMSAAYLTENETLIQISTRMHTSDGSVSVEERIKETLNVFPTSGKLITISGQQAVISQNEYTSPQLFIVTNKYNYNVVGPEDADLLIELAELIDFNREH